VERTEAAIDAVIGGLGKIAFPKDLLLFLIGVFRVRAERYAFGRYLFAGLDVDRLVHNARGRDRYFDSGIGGGTARDAKGTFSGELLDELVRQFLPYGGLPEPGIIFDERDGDRMDPWQNTGARKGVAAGDRNNGGKDPKRMPGKDPKGEA